MSRAAGARDRAGATKPPKRESSHIFRVNRLGFSYPSSSCNNQPWRESLPTVVNRRRLSGGKVGFKTLLERAGWVSHLNTPWMSQCIGMTHAEGWMSAIGWMVCVSQVYLRALR